MTTLNALQILAPNQLQLSFTGPLAVGPSTYLRNNYFVQTRFGPNQPVYVSSVQLADPATLLVNLQDAMLTHGLYAFTALGLFDTANNPIAVQAVPFIGVGLPQKCFDIKRHMQFTASPFNTAYATRLGSILEANGMSYDALVGDTGSAFVQVEQSLVLRTAQGEDLSIIGQNFGVARPDYAINNDDLYRQLIPIYASQPKGTLATISQLLTLLIGPQSQAGWVISDVVPDAPVIEIPSGALLNTEASDIDESTYLHADATVDDSTYPGDYLTADASVSNDVVGGNIVVFYENVQTILEAFDPLLPVGINLQVVLLNT